jgi:Tol biopolymer transport system component
VVLALSVLLLGLAACGPTEPPTASIPLDGRGGGVIVYSLTRTNNTNQLYLMNADGSGNTPLASVGGRPIDPVWSPDASKIAFSEHSNRTRWMLYVMNSDGSSPRQLTNQEGNLDWSPQWSPDGERLIFARTNASFTASEVWTIKPDGSEISRLGNVDGQGPVYSPDGSSIVYFKFFEGGGDICVMDSDGSGIQQLTDHPAEDWWPVWSPDGTKIAFQSKRDGDFEIWVMNPDGSGLTQLTSNGLEDEGPSWSPDGSKIAFSSNRDGHFEIYVMNSDGTDQRRLTNVNGNAISPQWKPAARQP